MASIPQIAQSMIASVRDARPDQIIEAANLVGQMATAAMQGRPEGEINFQKADRIEPMTKASTEGPVYQDPVSILLAELNHADEMIRINDAKRAEALDNARRALLRKHEAETRREELARAIEKLGGKAPMPA